MPAAHSYALITKAWCHLKSQKHNNKNKSEIELWILTIFWYRVEPQDLRFMGNYSDPRSDHYSDLHLFSKILAILANFVDVARSFVVALTDQNA